MINIIVTITIKIKFLTIIILSCNYSSKHFSLGVKHVRE